MTAVALVLAWLGFAILVALRAVRALDESSDIASDPSFGPTDAPISTETGASVPRMIVIRGGRA